MPTLLLRFPARRYHATPWGHHVNEGLIEWPPSPWRLLRALLSVGYTKCGWQGSVEEPWLSSPPAAARGLVETLSGVAPRYALPAAGGTHSRHYMPMGDFKNDTERTTLVFDTWAQVEAGELAITWDVNLADDAMELLADLASRIDYLGRSESWVQARLATEEEAAAVVHDCLPSDGVTPPGPGWEQVALLAAERPDAYVRWRDEARERDLATLPEPGGRRGKAAAKFDAERDAIRAMFPADTLACLQVDTAWLRRHGWSQPPGSRKILYWRRSDALQSAGPTLGRSSSNGPSVNYVLLALSTPSLNEHALPPLSRSLPQAETLHRQLLGTFGKLAEERHSPVLSGCDASGRPLRGPHRHAHLLPLDLNADGHIDHVLVWASAGIPALEQRVLRSVRQTYAKGAADALRLAWAGSGDRSDISRLPAPLGIQLVRTIGSGTHWTSATPFVAPRHLKPRGSNSLEAQVRAELASRGLPQPARVCRIDPQDDDAARRLRHHVRVRRFGPPPPADAGFLLRVEFAEAIDGPLCLGYGSHFGLGRFEIA